MKFNLILTLLSVCTLLNSQSKVWKAEIGNGMYRNPIIHADYSDPDVCRVGGDYWMTASSFNCSPGLPILHSRDLVNWTLVNYAIRKQTPEKVFSAPQHGGGVWAPCIRFHKGEFYIYYGDPDYGIYMLKTKDPRGEWSRPVLVKEGKGLIDPSPLWDDDGKAYISHSYAGSRAGLNSVVAIFPMTADGTTASGESRIVFDGHVDHPTIEGTKFHKRNGYYYILAPAGGVATGWQVALRSSNVYGPYDVRTVMHQGETNINGPHQGAWIETKQGEHWFIHFQDMQAYGRVVHLQPMLWKNNWPVIGKDEKGTGCGEPVITYRLPKTGKPNPVSTPPDSDEFDGKRLGLQWQWHANENPLWFFADAANSRLRLYSFLIPENYISLWQVPNLLLQKFPAPAFRATAKITFSPNPLQTGERAGLLVMGYDYAALSMESTEQGIQLSQVSCQNANLGNTETVNASFMLDKPSIYLRVDVSHGAVCRFSFSYDNVSFIDMGHEFKASMGQWIGAKIGFFITRSVKTPHAGWIDIDWFRIEGAS
jgi:beta-xylosidase